MAAHGKDVRVLYGGYELTTYFRSASAPQQVDTAETSAFGTTAKTYVIGLNGGTVNAEGMFSADAGGVNVSLEAAFGQETNTPLTICFGGNFAVGSKCLATDTKASSYNVSGAIGDIVSVTADWTVDGHIGGNGYVLYSPNAAMTNLTTGTGTGVQITNAGLPASMQYIATLHVLAYSVTGGSLAFKVAHSSDNVTYADLVTIGTPSAVGSLSVKSTAPVTLNQYVRLAWTQTSTPTGSITLAASFAPVNP